MASLEDELADQLQTTLDESTKRARSTRRPLLTHLNADTTWLLSIPIPSPETRNHLYYHILIDLWLRGGQSDVAKFFSQQWHATPSACQSIPEVEAVISGIEDAAIKEELVEDLKYANGYLKSGASIDAVVVSHEFTDHMHKETLVEIPSTVPVFASQKAAGIISSWKHFNKVVKIERFGGDWRTSSTRPLPEWLGISRVAYPGADLLYYHAAVMITFSMAEGVEAVIYTPHGISPDDIRPVADANPKIKTLALLHGLQDIKLGAQLNMGAHNGLRVQRILESKYWNGTHDEVKKGGGLVSWFLNRKMISLKEAIEQEKAERGNDLTGTDLESMQDVRFEELGNGESLVLE
ncbi:hypothetical protein LSUE1_G006655 [Lachnellula suecica]|uniref:Uncharacterized protein n=1 Tax=Lachnellula suecica TaxID=602035 RepID=A0A8T9C211_9HELO|nr:hypothetical protein LSUE1_G006655 [Lachnellula suecica]